MLSLLKQVLLIYFGFMNAGITCQYTKNSVSSTSQKAREIPGILTSNDFQPSFGSRLSTFYANNHHLLGKAMAYPAVSNINRSLKYRNQSQRSVPFKIFTQGEQPLDVSYRTKQSAKATSSADENKDGYPVNISSSSSLGSYRSNIPPRLNDVKYHIPKSAKKKLRKKQEEIQVISKSDEKIQNADLPNFPENDFPSVFGNIHSFPFDSQKLPIILEKQKSNPRTLEKDSGEELAFPCSCIYSQEECGCNCTGSLSYDDFQDLSKLFRSCSRFSFLLSDGDYYAFPPNLFYNVGCVQHFNLTLSNATFDYLFDPSPYTSAFGGVCFQKTGLVKLRKVSVRRAWNWTPLEQLKKPSGSTMDIEIDGCGLRRLSSDFSRVSGESLKTLSISDSELEMLGSGAFTRFEHMVQIRLPKNRLQSIHRGDLPPNPQQLQEMDLRYNRLESLEIDLFQDMPSLRIVSLAGNPIRMLSESTFGAVIGKTFLQGVSDFPLYCDCRLRWLKNSTLSQNTVVLRNLKDATCRRPPYLRGTPFKDLSKEHLIC
ncbi:Immunoglobulin superfamily containing leucine-rich repeat protein, partial [Stegodyphus mimosarum]